MCIAHDFLWCWWKREEIRLHCFTRKTTAFWSSGKCGKPWCQWIPLITSPVFHCEVCKSEDLARLYLHLRLGYARNCIASHSFILFIKYWKCLTVKDLAGGLGWALAGFCFLFFLLLLFCFNLTGGWTFHACFQCNSKFKTAGFIASFFMRREQTKIH